MGLAEPLGRHGVDLGEGYRSLCHPQQVEQFQVFAGLGHGPVIGGNDQQDEVDGRRAGKHVADQFFMPRHVDEAEYRAVGERGVGVAEVQGDAAMLFLRQAVGVGAVLEWLRSLKDEPILDEIDGFISELSAEPGPSSGSLAEALTELADLLQSRT